MPVSQNQYNRSAMPVGQYTQNPELADAFSQSPTFSTIANEVQHMRDRQAVRWNYTYHLSATVASNTTTPGIITIEQGTDFLCERLTISTFCYDAANASIFPLPNSAGLTSWSSRGLSLRITDSSAGRELTSGFVPVELLASPGFGYNMLIPYPFKYFFYRNAKIRFDLRNRETAAARADMQVEIALNGFKIMTPRG